MAIRIRDTVQCSRLGKGDYKVIELRTKGGTEEARIQSRTHPSEIHWIYTTHLSVNKESFRQNRVDKREEANKILSKPQKKR